MQGATTAGLAQGVSRSDPLAMFVEAGLPPLIAAVLATLGFWLKERLLDRDQRLQRRRAIEDGLSHLSYVKLWLETDALVGEGGQDVRAEARRELHVVRDRLQQAFRDEPRAGGPSAVRRALGRALLVPLHGTWARRVRIVYWASLWYGAFVLAVVFASTERDAVSLLVTVFLMIPTMLPSLGLYLWARRLATAGASPGEQQRPEQSVPGPLHLHGSLAARRTDRADGQPAPTA